MRGGHSEAVAVVFIGAVAMMGCSGRSLDGASSPVDAAPSGFDATAALTTTMVASFGGDPLIALWGSTSRDIWLVGGYTQNPEGGGAPSSERIVHFYGSGWSEAQTPSPYALFAVWGAAGDDVWSGGGDGMISGSGVILHYDGITWSQLAQLHDTVSAIWGSSSSDVWFAGGFSIWHWDGKEIGLVSAPKPTDDYLTLWGFSASDVWAAGATGTLVHWDGSVWTPVPTTSSLYIYGLWGASPNDLWGVGNGGYQLHWNGTAINRTSTLGYAGFNTIYGLNASDIWALGSCCWQDGGYAPWGAHYDGARWTYQEVQAIGFATALRGTSGIYSAIVNNTLVQWP